MKTRRFILLALTIAMCLTVTAFAAPSKTDVVEVTGAVDANKAAVVIAVSDTTIPLITETIGAKVSTAAGNTVAAEDLTVLWQKDITAETLPVTLTFHVDGTKDVPLYVFHYNGSDWELITIGVGEDVEATFTDLSPVAILAKKSSSGDPGNHSPETGDPTMVCIAVLGAMAIIGAVCVSFRKKSHS